VFEFVREITLLETLFYFADNHFDDIAPFQLDGSRRRQFAFDCYFEKIRQ